MDIKKNLDNTEFILKRYSMLIGIAIIVLLIVLGALTYINFDKQNQIIEKGGFIDGKVKCVCTQEAWDEYSNENKINLSNFKGLDG